MKLNEIILVFFVFYQACFGQQIVSRGCTHLCCHDIFLLFPLAEPRSLQRPGEGQLKPQRPKRHENMPPDAASGTRCALRSPHSSYWEQQGQMGGGPSGFRITVLGEEGCSENVDAVAKMMPNHTKTRLLMFFKCEL